MMNEEKPLNKQDVVIIDETAAITSTANKGKEKDDDNEEEEEEEEDWITPTTKNPKFPFKRRAPYFWFNRLCFLFCLGLFLLFSVQIISDYIKQKENPPTSSFIKSGLKQDFPGMAFCMHQTSKAYQPDLEPLFALYDDGSTNGGNGIDITTKLKRTECNGTYSSSTTSSPSNSSDNNDNGVLQKPAKCWYLDDYYSAFNTSTIETESCAHRNTISLGFYFNISEYDPNVMLIGVDGYLFQPNESNAVVSKLCQQLNNPSVRSCSNSMMTMKELKEEGVDYNACKTGLHMDTFFSTNKLSNIITLERSEVQVGPTCASDDTRVHWNPQSMVSNHNILYQTPTNDRNITLQDDDVTLQSTVLMHFQFRNGDISKTKYITQTFGTMFGSLGGWWGFLSDGWGVLSVLFIVEETINYIRATKFK